jgi:hypothetical protein
VNKKPKKKMDPIKLLVIKEWLREIKGIDLYDFVKAFKT